MTKKILLGLIAIFFLTFCSHKTSENQLSRADDFKIIINSPDTVGKDQECFASIHINNPNYKLIDATFDCTVTDTSTVDTHATQFSNGKIHGCNNALVIKNDSVKIWFGTGQITGKQNFEDITLLAKSTDGKYYYQKCTFDYYIK